MKRELWIPDWENVLRYIDEAILAQIGKQNDNAYLVALWQVDLHVPRL